MKKTVLFFITILFGVSVAGQLVGDGLSPATAYCGTITNSQTWTFAYNGGTIYVGQTGNEDLTITTGGSLSIEAGITVKFCTTASDLKTTGTGILTANGSGSSYITFTKDAQATWGHLTFTGSGISQLSYCIIEWGYKAGVSEEGYGGGLHLKNSNVTVSNCILRNNYATWGGGIMVDESVSPQINSCLIYSNTSLYGGAGIEIDPFSSPTFNNCIIRNNNNTRSNYGGGGVFLCLSGSAKFSNCTIVNNTSYGNTGANVYFSGTNNASLINTIVWSDENSIFFSGAYQSSNLINSAVQRAYDGSGTIALTSFTNCLDLGISNTGIDGPNFVNVTPGSEDYQIMDISPCRDAGTTTSPPIPTDILGNPRVGPYDIGAYEVQYTLTAWTGATSSDWAIATNWNPNLVPIATSHVIIPPATNNPSISFSDVTINDMLIESGASLSINALRTLTAVTVTNSGALSVINSGRFNVTTLLNESVFTVGPTSWATITNLTNNGTINLNSDYIDMFSLMFDTYSGIGLANIAMTVTGGGGTDNWKWHYVAVPINYRNNKRMFTDIDPVDLMEYNDFQIPDTPTATDNDGWVWHDGYVNGDPPGGPYSGQGFANLSIGKGYAFYHPNSSAVVNFSNLSSLQSSLGPLFPQYSGDGKLVPGNYGWNLLGNSLTCGIDWDLVIRNGNLNSAIYYTINYKIGMYVQGSGGTGINGATKNIPALQGFLVKANETGTSLDFSSARQNTSQHLYKKSLEIKGSDDSKGGNSVVTLIRLELNNSGNQDETLIWFNDQATNSFDRDFDALKLFSGGAFDQIYTLNGTQKFGISGIPFPTETITIPVVVKVVNAGSNYKIIASQLQGLENYNVTLTDKGNSNFITDLKNTGNYTFSSDAGTFPDRFVITIGAITTGVPDVIIPDKVFNVFEFNGTLNIEVLNDAWEGKKGTINLYNLTGIKVLQQNNIEWYRGDIKKIPLNLPQGIYIVEIKAENQKFVTKISIIK